MLMSVVVLVRVYLLCKSDVEEFARMNRTAVVVIVVAVTAVAALVKQVVLILVELVVEFLPYRFPFFVNYGKLLVSFQMRNGVVLRRQ